MSIHLRPLGKSDLQVSNVCLGTMTFGQQNSESEAHAQLEYAVSSGVNFIDTAEMYPVPPRAETVHRTEEIVGNWLQHQSRDQLVVATKVTGAGRNMKWIRGGALPFDRNNIRAAIEASLKRLKTDYIDLYQLHWPERNTPMFGHYLYAPEGERSFTPVEETLRALSELVEEGKVRAIGLSNEWPWGMMQFLNAAKEYNLTRVASVQNAYNLINRTFDTAMAEMSYREQVPLLAYSPLAFGHLSGKYLQNPPGAGRVNLFDGFAQRYEKPAVPLAVAAYAEAAHSFGMTPAQFALAFVYSRWFCASTIIGSTSMEQLEENLGAASIEWSEEMEQAVEAIHLRYFNPAP